ncbi:MAG: hypothetical protein WA951_11490, partial [Leeuwenhoekiella sp.]
TGREELIDILEKRIVDITDLINKPYFFENYDVSNGMIFRLFKKHKKQELINFQENKITSLEDIEKLLRNFAPFFNGQFFAPLEKENYSFISSILNVSILYDKALIFGREIVFKINSNQNDFSNRSESTPRETLEEFIYWYERDKKDQDDSFNPNDSD